MRLEDLKANLILHGPLFPEPVQVIVVLPMGTSVKLVGKGIQSNTVYEPILNAEQLARLSASPANEPFDGDARKFRLGNAGCGIQKLPRLLNYRQIRSCRTLNSWRAARSLTLP